MADVTQLGGNLDDLAKRLNGTLDGWRTRATLNWPILRKRLGVYMVRSVGRNIRLGGRPNKFKPLALSTLKRRGGSIAGAKPLWSTGQHIMNRIEWKPLGLKGLEVSLYGSAPDGKDCKLIGEVQHFGSLDGHIPARPFLLIPDSDVPELDGLVTKWIEGAVWQKPGSMTL
jgi:hypothetical protein